jgi:hypothetical protein
VFSIGFYVTALNARQATHAHVPSLPLPLPFPCPFVSLGRGLLQVELPASYLGAPLVAATSHLESPCPPNGWFTAERQEQAARGLELLEQAGDNVLWAGGGTESG